MSSQSAQRLPPGNEKTTANVGRFADEFSIDPANLRGSMLKLILKVSSVLGLLVYLPSVYAAYQQGFGGVVLVETLAVATTLSFLVFEPLPVRVRATVVCLMYYALGVCLLLYVGSVGQIFLFAFSIVAVLLLGARAGLWAALLSAASLFGVGVLGFAAPDMTLRNWNHTLMEWMAITLNFALVNVLITVAVGTMVTAVNRALAGEIASRRSLDGERSLLRTLIDTLPDPVFTKDAQGRVLSCNPAALEIFGLQREQQAIGKTVFDLYPLELAELRHADDLGVMAGHSLVNSEERNVDREGNPQWYLTIKVPLRDADNETVGLIAISRKITARKLAQAERDRLISQLQVQIERMPLAYMLCDRDIRITRWNPAAERILGFTEKEMLGKSPLDVLLTETSRPYAEALLETLKAGNMEGHVEIESSTKSGQTLTCEWHNTPIFDDDGAFAGLLSLGQDVTARKTLEAQLRQSQKMEAVGQLAGGIAHDFNNLLSVILSYSDLLLIDLKAEDPLRADIDEIRRAASRAAELTRQLLMFSRQQVVEPKVLDLNTVLSGVDKMVRRLIGEDIEFTSMLGSSLGRIRADQGSIEQVIMNLIVNARDAMPVGGKLSIETANVTLDDAYAVAHLDTKAGDYVMLSVTDTGTGMDKATLARIFEPFFTTKEKGKGTGLGLSTVFGIAQQSGGTVWVYSEPGIGTTFKVYLPRVDGDAEAARPLGAVDALRGTETILLVEDEEQVRGVVRGILLRQGYAVLNAGSARDAVLLSQQHVGPIHLLLSDVVMPHMSGPALAKHLAPARPEMKVLCMSGYTDDAAVRHGVVEAEFAFLQKPITVDSLSRKVRGVLDSNEVRA
jgi:two-component system cell cycle sensor histidine kinase/response regulator CckA